MLVVAVSQHALAQSFPNKPLRIIVPFPAGGTLGADVVAKAAPDGHTLLEAEGWNGLFALAKTPRKIIDRLQRETLAAVRHPDSVKRFTDLAAEPVSSSSVEQDAVLRRQIAQFRPVIQTIKLE